MKKLVAFAAFASLLMVAATSAPLAVGSKAPALAASKWMKGEPVKKFEEGTVYLVEFWATWCGPCVQQIPHLTELQKKHGDKLVVIGVAGSERKPRSGADNRLDKLKVFLAERGSSMGYRVVYDPTQATYNAWMTAAGERGIPCSFLVDHTGKIRYIGHPSKIDATLAAVVKAAPEPKKKKSAKDDKSDKSDKGGKDDKDASDKAKKDAPSGGAGAGDGKDRSKP